MPTGNMLWFWIGGAVFLITLVVSAVLYVVRRARDEADVPEEAPAPRPVAPAVAAAPPRPVRPVQPAQPARPVTPPEPSLYTYPGLRGGWWICPNCTCENEPERTRCSVCLWDRTTKLG